MKLGKLSLAAVLAVGALASFASAKPLSDAIKNVDVSGSLTAKYSSKHTKNVATENKWEFESDLDTNIKLDDNFFAEVGIKYDQENSAHPYGYDNGDDHFQVYDAYLGYKVGGTTLQVGRQAVGSFVTDDLFGNGVKVVSTDIQGLTLTGGYFNTLHTDSDVTNIGVLKGTIPSPNPDNLTQQDVDAAANNAANNSHSIYEVGAVGSYNPFSFQTWFTHVTDVANYYALEAALNFDLSNDMSFGLTGQFGKSSFKKVFAGDKVKSGTIYGLEARTGLYGLDASLGYVNYSTKDGKSSGVSFEDRGSFLSAGEQTGNHYQNFMGKNKLFYGTLGYTFFDGKIRVGGDVVSFKGKDMDNKDKKTLELVARASYKYTDSLTFKGYFSSLKNKNKDTRTDKVKFQAVYSF